MKSTSWRLNLGEWAILGRNLLTFLLPDMYNLLSRYWVTKVNAANLTTHAAYEYVGTAYEICYEGLPRAAYRILGKSWRDHTGEEVVKTLQEEINDDNSSVDIGHQESLQHSNPVPTVSEEPSVAAQQEYMTLVVMQYGVLLLFFVVLQAIAPTFSKALTPVSTSVTVTYIRLSIISSFLGGIDYTNGYLFRALHWENVPMYSALAKVVLNLTLDLLFISPYRVTAGDPTIITQVGIRLGCDLASLLVNCSFLAYLFTADLKRSGGRLSCKSLFDASIARLWLKHGCWPFLESLVRNTFYLLLVKNIVQLSGAHAKAWATFNGMRWSVIMIPVKAAEYSVGALLGKRCAIFRAAIPSNGIGGYRLEDLTCNWLFAPLVQFGVVAVVYEIAIYIGLAAGGARAFALWLSNGDHEVAELVQVMWQRLDLFYILFAFNAPLTSALLAVSPPTTFLSSFVVNLLYNGPWILVVSFGTTAATWTTFAYIFGFVHIPSLVVNLMMWAMLWVGLNKLRGSALHEGYTARWWNFVFK